MIIFWANTMGGHSLVTPLFLFIFIVQIGFLWCVLKNVNTFISKNAEF